MPHLRAVARLNHLFTDEPSGFVVLVVCIVVLSQPARLPFGESGGILRQAGSGIAVGFVGFDRTACATAQDGQHPSGGVQTIASGFTVMANASQIASSVIQIFPCLCGMQAPILLLTAHLTRQPAHHVIFAVLDKRPA
uniref:Uncharacterized protein n=1 Tax=Pectobacterium versatile TaxID=2488639 RepID=A0A855MNU4_9GAMM|nr:hypothetical protein F131LOC_01943 [Pectobacterium versatile]